MENNIKATIILLCVCRSTIYRELKRNCGKTGRYNPDFAQELAEERKERFCKHRKFDGRKQQIVTKWICEEEWSPEQIKGYCDAHSIDMVSHERIYQYIREDKVKGGKLYKNLRHKLKYHKRPLCGKHEVIKNKVSIDQRPEIINNKGRFGDWEIDLIVDKKQQRSYPYPCGKNHGYDNDSQT